MPASPTWQTLKEQLQSVANLLQHCYGTGTAQNVLSNEISAYESMTVAHL